MRTPSLALAIALLSSACGDDGGTSSTTDTSTATDATTSTDATTAADTTPEDTATGPVAFDSDVTATVSITIQMPPTDGVTPDPIVVTADLPGHASGTWTPSSGALSATLTFEDGTLPVVTADATVAVGYKLAADDAATGTFAAATGEGSLDADLKLTVVSVKLGDGEATEVAAPCDVGLGLAMTGAVDLDSDVLTVTQSGFAVTSPSAEDCGGLGGTIGQLLGGPTNSMSVSFSVAPATR